MQPPSSDPAQAHVAEYVDFDDDDAEKWLDSLDHPVTAEHGETIPQAVGIDDPDTPWPSGHEPEKLSAVLNLLTRAIHEQVLILYPPIARIEFLSTNDEHGWLIGARILVITERGATLTNDRPMLTEDFTNGLTGRAAVMAAIWALSHSADTVVNSYLDAEGH